MTDIRTILVDMHQIVNMFSPINRIPDELLVMIFKDIQGPPVTRTLPSLYMHTKSYDETRSVVVLSHVCHHWRQTVLQTPTFWARIDGQPLDRLYTFMERARDVPMTLFLYWSVGNKLATILGATSAKRLRRIDIALDYMTEVTIAPLITWAAPDLECLVLLTHRNAPTSARASLASVQLLAGRTHALKALALQYIASWLPSNTFPSLTHLHLHFALSTNAQTPEILAVLSNAPALEFIHIGELFHRQDTKPVDQNLPVVLSRLRYLALVHFAYTRAMSLLEHLSFPDNCFVCLDDLSITPAKEGDPRRLVDIGPLHNATRLDLASAGIVMLLVADSDTSGFWMRAETREDGDAWELWSHNLPTMISLYTILSLHMNIFAGHTFWPTVLPQFTALVELKVFVGSSDPCPDDTSPIDVLCTTLSSQPVVLPSLLDLYVEGSYYILDYDQFFVALVGMVAFRSRSGHRLRRFSVQPQRINQGCLRRSVIADCRRYVDEFKLVGGNEQLCSFNAVRDIWRRSEAEKYWRIDQPTRRYNVSYVLYR